MNRLKVLLVDDHDSFRHVLASFLRAQQEVELVEEAVDGIEAIDKADQLHPDLVLMDVHMPRRNGIETTRAIKDLSPKTMVIMMSMDSSENYARSARMVADGYIPKSSMKLPLLSLIADEQSRILAAGGNVATA
jgi:DNA-binding NarL/FixJ family response regulator